MKSLDENLKDIPLCIECGSTPNYTFNTARKTIQSLCCIREGCSKRFHFFTLEEWKATNTVAPMDDLLF